MSDTRDTAQASAQATGATVEEQPIKVGLVVVGAQKAFSSTLANHLGAHPGVSMLPGEFMGFLDAPYEAGQWREIFEMAARAAAPPAGRRGVLLGFKCSSYLTDEHVPARLYQDLEAPQVVVSLRNPVDRAVSAWYWYIRTGLLPVVEAGDGLRMVLDGRARGHRWRHAQEVLDWGLYSEPLARYRELFGDERLHVVLDIDFLVDPARTVRLLVSDLGLSPSRMPAVGHDKAAIYSVHRLRWLNLRQRLLWVEDEHGVWTSRRPTRVFPAAANAAVVGADRLVLSRLLPNRKPILPPDVRSRLAAFYADDIDRLGRDLGRDLSAWKNQRWSTT